ncbi:MAG: prfA3 [Parachlamydiales bacterium]|nr:prfA3 [Parachlamydiales bacterium]
MTITKEKHDALAERMQRCGLREQDLIEKFILGSGKGGQKVNKTASCVYLKHLPTGLEVKCQQERSRELNRYIARREMCVKLESKIFHEKSEKQMAMEKIRRQKRRRTRRQQEKMLEGKKLRGALKISRRPPGE